MEKMEKNDSPVSQVSVKLMKMKRKNLRSLEPQSKQILRIANYPNPVKNEMWFLTTDPFVGSFPSDNTAGLLSRTFIVKNISNSLTYTIASSCVCTSPLAVMTIVALHDFVKVSISALLRSFLLIMCIDAPESTTNSLSSGLRVDAGKYLFSEGEKNAAL